MSLALCFNFYRYNAKNKSALQPVLVKYGLPDPYAGHEYQTEEKVTLFCCLISYIESNGPYNLLVLTRSSKY